MAADVNAARQALAAAGFGADADKILKLVRPACFFRPAVARFEDDIPLGASKIGGRPDLAEDTPWPEDTAFLVQINLADVPDGALDIALPREGLISCFRNDEDWDNPAALLYTPPSAVLTRREAAEGIVLFAQRALRPSVVLTLDVDRADIPVFEDEEILDVVSEWVVPEEGVQLGGDRSVIQSGGTEGERLVLQIGSVEEVGMMWGDLGCLYISMRPDEIAALRFDKAVTDFQCY
ncbi:hypothetical protein FHS83_003723 [Rhizomicrobium palustre]|uniref:DUF1963 domain-containing protein n=1 Tax=Rhizomicrobium palustre TaxID=189966 RepID=A0A846N4K5_9PROT|nr:YwqG family protein [Rhizomicrobium palustre]NIK90405.1 hypothetical protein [Rhizomicrobium palustre]